MRSLSHRNLPHLFLKAREELMRCFRPILNHHGLTEQQWRILRALHAHGQLEPWEICEICQILSPSLAGVLARMDDTGLVVRTRVAEDQRRVIVELSDRGAKLVAAIGPLVEAQYKLIEKSLGRDLLNELYAALDRFLDHPSWPTIGRVALPVSRKAPGPRTVRTAPAARRKKA